MSSSGDVWWISAWNDTIQSKELSGEFHCRYVDFLLFGFQKNVFSKIAVIGIISTLFKEISRSIFKFWFGFNHCQNLHKENYSYPVVIIFAWPFLLIFFSIFLCFFSSYYKQISDKKCLSIWKKYIFHIY